MGRYQLLALARLLAVFLDVVAELEEAVVASGLGVGAGAASGYHVMRSLVDQWPGRAGTRRREPRELALWGAGAARWVTCWYSRLDTLRIKLAHKLVVRAGRRSGRRGGSEHVDHDDDMRWYGLKWSIGDG